MSALGKTYRWQVYNGTGVSVTCTVKTREWKFTSSDIAYAGSETNQINAVSVATLSYSNSSTVDNSTLLNLGADVTVTFAPGASATGTVALYLQKSTDDGTTWPSNGQGIFVGSIAFTASSASVTKSIQVR